VIAASVADVSAALASAQAAFPAWEATPASTRAAALERAADLMQGRLPELVALIVREGGRTQADAVSEVREAIDFCRYYAAQAREKFSQPIPLPGPTGERNSLSLHGRGVFVCISPWNFPLAIFVGQVAAALAAGNTVVAKPAEQTPLVAALAVELLHSAGIPAGCAQLPARRRPHRRGAGGRRECAGVAFTGSTEVARLIAQTLAGKDGPLVPLIAETGGQNTLIADSSALPEQIVRDVVASAFNSAGQRCSALRVLFVQTDIADRVNAKCSPAPCRSCASATRPSSPPMSAR
jgi:RHH-type proline utilization regulon transcriptional repressor/proline dehydrogenase/delta 1-pyrroline-5-carboxylate dehydrogenase